MLQEGACAIHLAAFQGHTEVIELLVDQYSVDPGTLSSVRLRHCYLGYFTHNNHTKMSSMCPRSW